MKKTLISALTTALVIGAASTTFAAANPFSDVPADHWAYDAVSQLAKDGVIEGYGDSTFQGQNSITRYEMAQMVAKAMAREDQANAADKAMIDKLAAEFSDELNNLGVRVSNLEKKTDNVKFTGEARYRYESYRHDDNRNNAQKVLLRLEPTATVNEHWAAKARIDYAVNADTSENASTTVDRAWVQGKYDNLTVNLGKLPNFTNQGLIMDERVSGAQLVFGKSFKTTITAGRYNFDTENTFNKNYAPFESAKTAGSTANGTTSTASYQSITFAYPTGKWNLAAGYHHLAQSTLKDAFLYEQNGKTMKTAYGAESANIWEIGAGYKFSNNFGMQAAYARNTQGNLDGKFNKAYNVELDYKGAKAVNKGSSGAFVAYRYLGNTATISPTYDAIKNGQKGWELGAQYAFAQNILGTVKYFTGKDLVDTGDTNASKLFGQVEFFF